MRKLRLRPTATLRAVAVYAAAVTILLAFTVLRPHRHHAPHYDGSPIEQPLFAEHSDVRPPPPPRSAPAPLDARTTSVEQDDDAGAANFASSSSSTSSLSSSSTADGERTEEVAPVQVAPSPTPRPSPAPSTPWALEYVFDKEEPRDKVCRIRGACLAHDGALVVGTHLQAHAERLAECGVSKVLYQDNLPRPARHDLIGHVPMRGLMSDFVKDLLPTWYAREVMRASFTYGRKSRSRTCILGKRTAHGDQCGEEQLKIAMYAEQHINELSRSAWVHSILQRIPGRPHVQLPPQKNNLVCYKSIVAYRRNSMLRAWSGWYGPKQRFYTFNNVSRNSVLHEPPPQGRAPCNIKVLMLNRLGWLTNGEWRVGRDIMNANDVKEAIEKMGKRRNYNVTVEEATFEGASFGEQIAHMQAADVVLGAHGGALANLLFARLDTGVVEAFPFGYRPDTYAQLAAALHVKHRGVMAEPDFKYVLDCVNKKAKLYKDDNIRARGQRTWRVAVDQWRAGLRLVLHAESFRADKVSAVIRRCIRSQRMELRPRTAAKAVLDEAKRICKGRVDYQRAQAMATRRS